MTTTIDNLKRQLRGVMEDLSTMARHMAGTEWHMDRVEEARFLVREIERLVGEIDDTVIDEDAPFIETAYCCGKLLIGDQTCSECGASAAARAMIRPAMVARTSRRKMRGQGRRLMVAIA